MGATIPCNHLSWSAGFSLFCFPGVPLFRGSLLHPVIKPSAHLDQSGLDQLVAYFPERKRKFGVNCT